MILIKTGLLFTYFWKDLLSEIKRIYILAPQVAQWTTYGVPRNLVLGKDLFYVNPYQVATVGKTAWIFVQGI